MAGNLYDDTLEQLPAAPANPYDDVIKAQDAGSQQQLRTSFSQAVDQAPDTAATAAKIAERSGLPVDVVQRNLPAMQKRARIADTPFAAMLQDTPALAAWATEPAHAAVAHDDMEQLGALEWLLTMPSRAISQSINEQKYGELRTKSIFQTLTQEETDRLNAYKLHAQMGGALGSGNSWFKGALTKTMKLLTTLTAPEALPTAIGAAAGATIGAGGGFAVGGPAGIVPGALAVGKLGAEAGYTYGLGASAFQTAAASSYDEYLELTDAVGRKLDPEVAKALAITTGAVNAGLMVFGGRVIAGGMEKAGEAVAGQLTKNAIKEAIRQPSVIGAIAEMVKGYGVTLTEGTALMVAMKTGDIITHALATASGQRVPIAGQKEPGNIDLFQQPAVKNLDGSVSTVDSFSVNIDGTEVLLPTVTPDGRHLEQDAAVAEYQKTGRHLGKFDSAQAATAFAKQLHEDYAAGHYTRPTVGQQLLQAAAEGVQSFALIAGVGPARGLARDFSKAKRAEQGVAWFQALGEGIEQSKTAQRLPEAAQKLLEQATKDGPVPTLYTSVSDWTKYWQDQGIDPAEMAAELTGRPAAYEEALKTGEDLAIPTARYATKLAATEHNTHFAEELRLGPEEMNGRESKALIESMKTQPDEQAPAAQGSPVYQAALEQLTEGGGLAPDTAAQYAGLVDAAFGTMAERAGVDPTELYGRYGLTVRRPDVPNEPQTPPAAGEAGVPAAPAPAGGQPGLVDEAGRPLGGYAAPGRQQAEAGAVALQGRSDIALPVMADVVGAAAEMRRENPDIDRQAKANRERALAAGRNKGGVVDKKADAAQNPENYFNAPEARRPATAQEGERSADAAGQQPGADVSGHGEGRGDGDVAQPRRVPAGIPELDEVFRPQEQAHTEARLTPEVERELVRILHEMERDTYEGASWDWLTDENASQTGGKSGNAAGGNANRRPGHGGAAVYVDILAHSPMNMVTSGRKKGQPAARAHGDRAKVEHAIRDLLEGRDVTNNLQEGALRVAENRNAGIWRDLSRPALAPHWGTEAPREFTDALSAAIDEAQQPASMLEEGSFEQDAVETADDGDTSFDFKEFNQSLFDDIAPPDPTVDTLADTGEKQARLPGDVGDVREKDVKTPEFEAPFSLTAEIAKPKGKQTTLFQGDKQLEEGRARVAELEAASTDEAMGVEFPEGEPSHFPDGSEAVVCTNCAEQIVAKFGGQIFGWEEGTNNTSVVAGPTHGARLEDGQGHDFAIVDDRYLVDPWAVNVEGLSSRAAFDLLNPEDRLEVARLYGDPNTWLRRTDSGWVKEMPAPLRPRPLAELTRENVAAWAAEVKQRAGSDLVDFSVFLTSQGDLQLDTISVARGAMRAGLGSRVMLELTRFADLNGRRILLTPAERGYSPDERAGVTSSTSRLVKFYKRFGFVENKGRTRDFTLDPNIMHRDPTAIPGREFAQPLFHGSPHDFERFSLEHVGTGEGAAAYGHGLYFAENPSVAAGYHDRLAGQPQLVELKVGTLIANERNSFNYSSRAHISDKENIRAALTEQIMIDAQGLQGENLRSFVLNYLDQRIKDYATEWPEGVRPAEELRAELAKKGALRATYEKAPGGIYQVDIPDEHIDKMLDWEKPLEEQPAAVQRLAKEQNLPAARVGLEHVEDGWQITYDGKPVGVPYNREQDARSRMRSGFRLDNGDAVQGSTGEGIYHALTAELERKQAAPLVAERTALEAKYFREGQYSGASRETLMRGTPDWKRWNEIDLAIEKINREAPKQASAMLAKVGVPGLRYLDAGSRDAYLVTSVDKDGKQQGAATFSTRHEADAHAARMRDEFGYETSVTATEQNETRNVVVFDDSIVKLTHKNGQPYTDAERKEFFQEPPADRQQKRGAIRFGPDRQFNIDLLERADLSTFLHESGHFFLEVFGDLADEVGKLPLEQLTEEQRHLLSDYGTTLQALGVENRDQVDTPQHEAFARMFEAYLREGQAPSLALQTPFARFRAWLLSIYDSLKKLNINLTPEVRGVLDRMLASDHAIAEAEQQRGVGQMFLTAEDAGMDPREFELYARTVKDAHREAQQRLDEKLMREVFREQERAWKEQRAEIKTAVEGQVYERPEYRAIAAMKHGTHPNGDPLVEGLITPPLQLSRGILEERFGAERIKRLPRGIVAREGGLDPDVVAEMFGYSSSDAMLAAVEKAPAMRDVIEQETKRQMLEQHGSILLDGSLAPKAQAAVANETRDEVIRAEMRALGRLRRTVDPFVKAERAAGRATLEQERAERDYERRWFEAEAKLRIAVAEGHKQVEIDELTRQVRELKAKARGGAAVIRAAIPPAGTLKAAADARISAMRVGDIKPEAFWSASRRAGQQALERAARQDFDGAITAKQQELINLALYRRAEQAKADAEDRARFAQGLTRPSVRAAVGRAGATYLEQIDGILDRYEFARVSQKTLDRRASILDWVEALKAQGLPVDGLPPEVLNDARRINWRQVSVDELVGITDGLKQILHIARLKNKLLRAADKREFDAVRDTLVDTIRTNTVAREKMLEIRPADQRRRTVGDFFASHRKISSLLQRLDGHVDGGPVWDAIMRPLNEAGHLEETRRTKAGADYMAILEKHYPGRELARLNEKMEIPAIGGSLSHEARIAVGQLWGTETGRERLTHDPYRGWNEDQVKAILNTLDKRDWDFIADHWQYLDSYWPEIAAKQERVVGLAPEKVEALPVQTKFGEYPGGYSPIAYDSRFSVRAGQNEAASQAKLSTYSAYVQNTTKRGFIETRKAHTGLPVRLEMSVGFQHIDEVLHDLTHHETLIDVTRLLRDPKVSQAIMDTAGDQVYQQLTRGVQDIAIGSTPAARNIGEKAANFLRTRTQLAMLGLNLWTGLQQPLGLFNGMERVGVKWVAKGMARWLRDAATMESTTKWISDVSPMMRERGNAGTADLHDLRAAFHSPGGWFDTAVRTVSQDRVTQQAIIDGYLWHIGLAQRVADVPTWLGMYEKQMAADVEGRSPADHEARAIALADQAVLDSQGGGNVKDLAQLQRGGPYARMFMTFYSYGNTVMNATARAAERTNFRSPADVATFLGHLSLLYVLPALGTATLACGFGKKKCDDVGDFLQNAGAEGLSSAMNTLVYVRELASAAQIGLGLEPGARGYGGPAALRPFEWANKLAQEVHQGKLDEGLWHATNNVAGVLFRYPAAQVQRTVDGWVALEEGRTRNPAVLLVGPPKKK